MHTDGPEESDGVRVQRLRLSYVAARIHDRLREIGGPNAFQQCFIQPQTVHGVQLDLPFGDEVDHELWSELAERSISVPVGKPLASALLRAGVPLRHQGAFTTDADTPRLEAHIHPFGVVVITTVDLVWPQPVPWPDVWARVDNLEEQEATTRVGSAQQQTSTVREAARTGADSLLSALADPAGKTWDMPDYRITTVIEGVVDPVPKMMPRPHGPVQRTLHRLSRGDVDILPEPGLAFVAQWSGASFDWAPARLVYMLDVGTSVLSSSELAQKPVNRKLGLGGRHRRMTQLLAHVVASVGLLRAAPETQSQYFPAWATVAADRLGRLYGPAGPFQHLGLEARSFLIRTGAAAAIAEFTGKQLTARYPDPAYPSIPSP